MKRFVVIVTSLLIILVFIALNYLLWDRESLVTLRDSNQASIDTLSRMNMNLNQEKSKLEQQTESLKEQIEALNGKVKKLESDILEQKGVVNEKNKFIVNMKSHVNTIPVQEVTDEWIKNLNEKNFSEAYIKALTNCSFWGNNWTMRNFSDYFDQNVDKIELLADKENQIPGINMIPIQTPDWEMSVYVHVQVKLKEGAKTDYLKEGENILHLTYTFSERLEQWVITSVFSENINMDVQTEKNGQ